MSPDVEAAIVRLTMTTPMNDQDFRDILAAKSVEDIQGLSAIYEASGRSADKTFWQSVEAVFGSVVEGAEEVAPLLGILQQAASFL